MVRPLNERGKTFTCVLLRSEISELQRTEKMGTGEDKRDKKSLRIFDELLISFNCHYEKIEDVFKVTQT